MRLVWGTLVAAVAAASLLGGSASARVAISGGTNRAAVADFNGDGLTDVAVFRAPTGMWYDRSTGQAVALGDTGDIPVPGDFNGDGRADFAVYRPSNGTWYDQSTGQTIQYGASNGVDEPVPGDFNGDGKNDIAIFRRSTATWYDRDMGTAIVYGAPNLDIPVPGDYNGDGKTDIAVFRPTTGTWYIRTTGAAFQFGQPGDLPLAVDLNGDGKTDIAVYRAATATWLDRDTSQTIQYGAANHDVPVPGDYNGDRKTDVAVYRPSSATWYNRDAASATVYGAPGVDVPVSATPAWFLVGSDTSPPTTPTGLGVTGTTATTVTVGWNASRDNVDVTGYGHYRDGALVDSAMGTTYTYTGLTCNTSYTLAVDATDAAGNRSGKASVSATTDACTSSNVDWLQFDGSPSHTGFNGSETTITPANVAQLQQHWQITVTPGYADGAPAVATGVQTSSGVQDLVVVTTRGGGLMARNLETGAAVWSITFGPGTCTINNQGSSCYTTSSPVIDRATNAAYTYGLDGKVHKVDLGTGAEVTTAPWPVQTTKKPWDEKGSSALASATANGHTYVYAVHAGYPGDGGDYQGHLVAIDLAGGANAVHVFNTLCSDQVVLFASTTPDCAQKTSGVWARSGVTYSAATNRIYIATGNALFDASRNWGDTVLALNPDGTGVNGGPVDSYTPTNFQQLDTADLDLGSTLPALVDLPTPNGTLHLGVQGGKEGILSLLNMANLSGQSGPGHTGGSLQTVTAPGGNGVLSAPAVWTDGNGTRWIFVATDGAVAGYTLALNASNQPQLTRAWQVSIAGTSPVVANGVLYVAGGSTVRALNPATGAQLWSAATGAIHWQSPVVADGLVLLEDNAGHLTAWGP